MPTVPIELLWIAGIVLLMGAASAFFLIPWETLLAIGNAMGLYSMAAGVPLELVYFALLAWALRGDGSVPKGWYWRSFAYHDHIPPKLRPVVLPWFFLGALCFLAGSLGIVVVIMGVFASVF